MCLDQLVAELEVPVAFWTLWEEEEKGVLPSQMQVLVVYLEMRRIVSEALGSDLLVLRDLRIFQSKGSENTEYRHRLPENRIRKYRSRMICLGHDVPCRSREQDKHDLEKLCG